MMSTPESKLPLRFDFLVEDAGSRGCMVHIPALPGLNFRVENTSKLKETALARITKYAHWLLTEDLADLTAETALLTYFVQTGTLDNLQVVVTERMAGAPVWESGNPAVLFGHDREPLEDGIVSAHLRFVCRVLDVIHKLIEPLSAEQRAGRSAPDRRSIDETLTHLGNCVWWYCSRIDDQLPEPDDVPDESPLDRIGCLFDASEAYLLGVPFPARSTVHVPQRFPTSDPQERWTHTKVCRRQAEHVWAHLPGLKSAVQGVGGSEA